MTMRISRALPRRRRLSSRSRPMAMLLARTPLARPVFPAVPPSRALLPAPTRGGDAAFLCRLAAALAARRRMSADPLPADPPPHGVAPAVAVRQLAMYLAHVVFGLSQVQVARRFGRDRRTVARAVRRVEERRDEAGYDADVQAAEQLLRWVVQP